MKYKIRQVVFFMGAVLLGVLICAPHSAQATLWNWDGNGRDDTSDWFDGSGSKSNWVENNQPNGYSDQATINFGTRTPVTLNSQALLGVTPLNTALTIGDSAGATALNIKSSGILGMKGNISNAKIIQIDTGGTLRNDQTANTNNTITGTGSINLQGGTIGRINDFAGGWIFDQNVSGYGTLSAPITVNSGKTLTASGGISSAPQTLTLSNANLTNSGTIEIKTYNTLNNTSGNVVNLGSGNVSMQGGTLAGSGGYNYTGANFSGYGTISAPLTNSGTVKASGGTLNVSGSLTNTETGTFDILNGSSATATSYTQTAGKTIVNGTFTSPVTINGGILQGSGLIIGNVAVGGGTVGPGNSPGILSVNGDYTQTGGILDIQLLNNTLGSGYDRLYVNGTANLGGTLQIELLPDYILAIGDKFEIIKTTGGISNPFTSFTLTGSPLTGSVTGFKLTTEGNSMFISAVPIPASLWLLASGLIGLVGVRRRVGANVVK